MTPRLPVVAVLAAITMLAAGCAGAGTPAATSTPAASSSAPLPSPTAVPVPSTVPAGSAHVIISASTTQALAPQHTFAQEPIVAITDDGRAIRPGPQDAIYPGPLLPNLQQRAISKAGVDRLRDAARAAGLLGTATDFGGGAVAPGGVTARLIIVADGTTHELIGSPTTPAACTAAQAGCAMPQAGTPAAFAWYWGGLQDLEGWLGADVASESPYVAEAYALLVGPPPDALAGAIVMTWPLPGLPLATLGSAGPLSGWRCATISGADASAARPSLAKANALTPWVDSPTQNATRSLIVRPLMPGEPDPCGAAGG